MSQHTPDSWIESSHDPNWPGDDAGQCEHCGRSIDNYCDCPRCERCGLAVPEDCECGRCEVEGCGKLLDELNRTGFCPEHQYQPIGIAAVLDQIMERFK